MTFGEFLSKPVAKFALIAFSNFEFKSIYKFEHTVCAHFQLNISFQSSTGYRLKSLCMCGTNFTRHQSKYLRQLCSHVYKHDIPLARTKPFRVTPNAHLACRLVYEASPSSPLCGSKVVIQYTRVLQYLNYRSPTSDQVLIHHQPSMWTKETVYKMLKMLPASSA